MVPNDPVRPASGKRVVVDEGAIGGIGQTIGSPSSRPTSTVSEIFTGRASPLALPSPSPLSMYSPTRTVSAGARIPRAVRPDDADYHSTPEPTRYKNGVAMSPNLVSLGATAFERLKHSSAGAAAGSEVAPEEPPSLPPSPAAADSSKNIVRSLLEQQQQQQQQQLARPSSRLSAACPSPGLTAFSSPASLLSALTSLRSSPSPVQQFPFDLRDVKLFLHSPLPPNTVLCCTLRRDKKSSLSARFFPTYSLSVDEPLGPDDPQALLPPGVILQTAGMGAQAASCTRPRLLIYAQKKSSNRYLMRMCENEAEVLPILRSSLPTSESLPKIKESHAGYVGCVRSNLVGNKYSLNAQSYEQVRNESEKTKEAAAAAAHAREKAEAASMTQADAHLENQLTLPLNAVRPMHHRPRSLSTPNADRWLAQHGSERRDSLMAARPQQDGSGGANLPSICDIEYEINIFSRAPRHLSVTLPGLSTSIHQVSETPVQVLQANGGTPAATTPTSASSSSFSLLPPRPLILISNQPRWNSERGCHMLNFHGRAPVASQKNFQLVMAPDAQQHGETAHPSSSGSATQVMANGLHDATGECASSTSAGLTSATSPSASPVILQLGKKSDHEYNVDIRHPLSPIQAFAIVLSAFDYKLAVD
jgi:hypothetical protein